jgi:hypothetical protein
MLRLMTGLRALALAALKGVGEAAQRRGRGAGTVRAGAEVRGDDRRQPLVGIGRLAVPDPADRGGRAADRGGVGVEAVGEVVVPGGGSPQPQVARGIDRAVPEAR